MLAQIAAPGGSPADEFLVKEGRSFGARPRPADVPQMPRGWCFVNAACLLLYHDDWNFGEGYVLGANGEVAMHGWAVTAEGDVVDPTFQPPEVTEYYGVVFQREPYLKWVGDCRGDADVLWSFRCFERKDAALKRGEPPLPLAGSVRMPSQ